MATDENGFLGCLKDFVSAHERGWNHHEWLGLLAELTDAGYDTSDPDHIGMALERERVKRLLEGTAVKGLGPRRRDAVAERVGTVWNLQHASVDDLTGIKGFHRPLAEALHAALH
jgi:excinuclease ABC subunit C